METTGYYGGYVNTLVALSGVADQQSAIAARDQVMQQRQQQSQLDATTRNTLLTMFNRQMQNQTKLDYYDANDAVANQYRSAGQAIMGSDPQTGLNLLKEADQFGLQNTQQRLAASRVAQDTSNRLAAFAGLVDDQTGLDDYKALLAQTGQQLPEQYSTMNDATKAYLRRTAALALPADKMLTLQQRNLEYQMRLQRSAEKTAHEKVLEAQRDRENAARRENQDQREVSGNVNLTAPKSETALLGEERALEVFDETGVFKNLPDPAKRTATIAVFSRARDLAQANPNAASTELLEQAKRDVIARVVPGEGIFEKSKYLGFAGDSPMVPRPKELPKTIPAANGLTYALQPDGTYLPVKGGR